MIGLGVALIAIGLTYAAALWALRSLDIIK